VALLFVTTLVSGPVGPRRNRWVQVVHGIAAAVIAIGGAAALARLLAPANLGKAIPVLAATVLAAADVGLLLGRRGRLQ
jgi:hypothetical protein